MGETDDITYVEGNELSFFTNKKYVTFFGILDKFSYSILTQNHSSTSEFVENYHTPQNFLKDLNKLGIFF